MSGALLIIVGAGLTAWAFMTPGDQLALSLLGGFVLGIGLVELVS